MARKVVRGAGRPFTALSLAVVLAGAVAISAGAQSASSPDRLDTRPQSEVPPLGKGAPSRSYSDETGAPFIAELGQKAGDRPATMSTAERRATRERYDDLSASQAADLARRMFPDELATPVFDLGDPPGADLVRTSGRFAAVLKDDSSGQTGLMLSSSPVRQSVDQGADPVDLSLQRVGESFKPEVPLIDTRFSDDAQQALRFPGRDVSVGLATSSEREPLVRDDRANHFEAATDTDLILTPRPEGAELYLQLRGPDSPTDFLLDVDMPAGATLRELKPENPIPGDTGGPWPIEVVDGERQLAIVYPPATHDAEGRPVPSQMRIEDGNLRLSVEHRGRLVAYPVLSDPEVYVPQYQYQPNSWAGWRHQIFRSGTSIQYNHYPNFGAALGNYAYGPGLYLSMPTNSAYFAGDFSELIWQAPPDVYVTRARLNGMGHAPYYSSVFHGLTNAPNNAWEGGVGYINQGGAAGPNPFGVASHAFNGVTHDFCYGSPGCNLNGSDQNNVVVGLQATPPSCCLGTGANKATMQANGVELYLGDRYPPALIGGIPPSRDWFDDTDNRTRTITPQATDRGLGISRIELSGAAAGSNTSTSYSCSGHPYSSPCPKDTRAEPRGLTYTTNEGTNQLSITALDATQKPSSPGAWTEKIDRSPPVLTGISGALYDARNGLSDRRKEGVNATSARLRVSATDAHSGIAGIDVTGVSTNGLRTSLATTTSNSIDQDVSLAALSDGDYTIEVRARDRVGAPAERHSATSRFGVTIDREGDVYHSRTYVDGDASTGSSDAEEWARIGTHTARSEQPDQILTRSPQPCERSSGTCGEVRQRSRNPGGESDTYTRYIGASENDPRLQEVSELLEPASIAGPAAATGDLFDVTRTFQRLPPGRGERFARYDSSYNETLRKPPATVSSDETSEQNATNSTSVDVRFEVRLYVDANTKMPIRQIVTAASENYESNTYWDYDTQRRSVSSYGADHFAEPRPTDPGQEKTVEIYGEQSAPATMTDKETQATFAPMFLGETPTIGAQPFCLATSFKSVLEEPGGGDVSEPQDGLQGGFQAAVTTFETAYNLLPSGISCAPGAGLLNAPPLVVRTASRSSSMAREWRAAYQAEGEAFSSEQSPKYGVKPVSISGTESTAYIIYIDAETTGVFIDMGDTSVIVMGPFGRLGIQPVLDLLRRR